MSDGSDDPMEALVGIVAVATLPLAALAAIFVGETAAAVVAIVGWFFLVPVLAILKDETDLLDRWRERSESDESTDGHRADSDDALQRLRERYAAGEIDDVEFERRLERLLETEGVEVPEHVDLNGTAGAGVDVAADQQPRTDRAREREPE